MKAKKNIKETLTDYKVDVNNDALWASLSDHIPTSEEKKNRFFPLWIFNGVVIVALVGFYFWTTNASIKSSSTNNLNIQQTANNSFVTSPIPNSKNEIAPLTISDTQQKELVNTIDHTTKSLPSRATQHYSTDPNNVREELTSQKSTDESISYNNQTPTYIVSVVASNSSSIHPTPSEIENNKSLSTTTQNIESLPQAPQLGTDLLKPNGLKYILYDQIEPIKSPTVSRFAVMIKTGSGFVRSTLDLASTESSYAEALPSYHSDLPSLSVEAQLQYTLTNSISIYGGLGYLKTTERLTIDNSTQVKEQLNNSATSIDSEGNITQVPSTTNQTTITDYQARHHTYHNIFSLPVGIQYNIYQSGSFAFYTAFGANINLLSFDQGAILDEDNYLDIFTSTNSPYNHLIIRPHLGLGLGYDLSQSSQVGLSLDISMQKSNYKTPNYSINQNTFINGINLNYRIKF